MSAQSRSQVPSQASTAAGEAARAPETVPDFGALLDLQGVLGGGNSLVQELMAGAADSRSPTAAGSGADPDTAHGSALDALGHHALGFGGGLFGRDDEELAQLRGVPQATLAADPNALRHYESYLVDPLLIARNLLCGAMFLDWGAFANMDAVCQAAARAEQMYLEARGDGGARLGRVATLPSRVGTAMGMFRGVATLGDNELLPLLGAVRDDARLGAAQAFVVAAFAQGAHLLAERLYRMELALAKGEGLGEAAAERRALGVYTRAMPAGQTQEDIAATRRAYDLLLTFEADGETVEAPVQTPYHISTRLDRRPSPIVKYSESDVRAGDETAIAKKRVAYGKGNAEQVKMVMEELVSEDAGSVRTDAASAYTAAVEVDKSEEEASVLAGKFITQWMSDHDVGVDCSGFVFAATAESDEGVEAGWQHRDEKGLSTDLLSMDGTDVASQKKRENSEPIPVSAARAGDLVVNKGVSHIGVVEVPATRVTVADIPKELRKDVRAELKIPPAREGETHVWEVGIAHSSDLTQGQGGTDGPGPHLGTYWFSEDGRRLACADVEHADSTFSTFHRPLLAPPGDI